MKKVLNRYNGNLCFAGETYSPSIVFECNRINEAVLQITSSKYITGLCNVDFGYIRFESKEANPGVSVPKLKQFI